MNHFTVPPTPGPLDHGPVRLRLGAAAGVLGVLFAVGRVMFAASYDQNHVARALAWAAGHPAEVFLVDLCEMLGFSLIAFSCVTLTGLVRGRGKWLTQIGGWGTAISFLVIAFSGSGALMASLASWSDRHAAVGAITHFEHSGQVAMLLVPMISSILWPILLGFGLPRAGLVGWWYAGLVVVWTVLEAVVSSTGPVALIANIVPLALVVAVWVKLLLDRAQLVMSPAGAEVSLREGTAEPAASRS
jgi:hypothetical protein